MERERDRPGDWKAARTKEAQLLRANGPLAAQFEDSAQAIRQLHAALHASLSDTDQTPMRILIDKCLSRLTSWGNDSGASSRVLDHRLRRASKPQIITLRLLKDLHEHIVSAIDSLPTAFEGFGDRPPKPLQLEPFGPPSSASAVVSQHADRTEIIDILGLVDPGPDSSPEKYLEDAEDIIDDLASLLPTLLDPQDDSGHEPLPDADELEVQDRQHVKQAFPKAPEFMTERLVKANRRRRQNLAHLKGEAPKEAAAGQEGGGASGTAKTSLLQAPSAKKPRAYPASARFRGYRKTQTSAPSESEGKTAPSSTNKTSRFSRGAAHEFESVTSFTSFESPAAIVPLEPPRAPVDLKDDKALPFKCPYCSFQVPLGPDTYHKMDENDWVAHFYLDLQPYLCTFEDCSRATKIFGVKTEWFQHELDYHRSKQAWLCAKPECRMWFDTQEKFEQHLKSAHQDWVANADVKILVDNCKRLSLDSVTQEACLLCGLQFEEQEMPEWRDHIGHHLEQIALTALGEDDSPAEGDEPDRTALVDEYVGEMQEMMDLKASKGSPGGGTPKEQTLADTTKPGESGNDHVFTDSSNLENVTGDRNHRREAERLWEDKVNNFLEKQPEEDKPDDSDLSDADFPARLNMPERNSEFVGRKEDLEKLHEHVAKTGHICVMSGRGGIGKTATAVEFSHRFEDSYAYVIWVEAETSGGLSDKYNRIGNRIFRLGSDEDQDPLSLTLSIREALARWDKRWLLIFDNVEAWDDIARYIPRNLPRTKGSVLITTRKQDLIEADTPAMQLVLHRHELEPLTSDESGQFLLCSIDRKLDPAAVASHPDYELAVKASELVERLPLALIMIAGYVGVSRATLEDFLEIWDEKQAFRAKLAKRNKLITEGDLDSSIDLLWDIGISELSVPARNLLEILAFLDPENIQRDLLVGDHNEEYLEFLNATEAIMYKRMIRQLSGRKLIDVRTSEAGNEMYRIHRLLQRKIVMDIGAQLKFDSAMRKATRLVRKVFPGSPAIQEPAPQNWPACREHMPHVYSLWRAYQYAQEQVDQKQFDTFERTQELADVFYDAGFYVWDRQATEYDGLALLGAAEDILDHRGVDANHELRADIHCMSGLLRNTMGCRERAESLRRLELARGIREYIYQHDANRQNDVLLQNAAVDYAILLLNNYQFARAEKILEKCLRRYREWGTEQEIPFEYSKYYYNMGVVRMWQGRLGDAIDFLQRSVELAEAAFGKEGQFWDNLFMLACVTIQTDNVQRALDLHLEALAAKLDKFGKHARTTILSTYAVGATYAALGDITTAIGYMERCIEIATSSTTWTEEALARAQFRLSLLYEQQGIKPEATEDLKAKAFGVLDTYKEYATKWTLGLGDGQIILDDLQPTDEGRFIGRSLLQELWKRRERGEI